MRSPNYPNPYKGIKDCANQIRLSQHHRVKITFLEFDVQSSNDQISLPDNTIENWLDISMISSLAIKYLHISYFAIQKMFYVFEFSGSSRLDIYEGTGYYTNRLATLCGSTTPSPIYSDTNEVFIRFHSKDNGDGHKRYRILIEEIGIFELIAMFREYRFILKGIDYYKTMYFII